MKSDEIKLVNGTFYFDIISPFSYFYVKQRHQLEDRVNITPTPILLGGLFRATDNRGPGEIEVKRAHTYQYCVWLAEKLGLPFRFPKYHPFLTVAAQRLLVQEKADWTMIERAFDFVWAQGQDPNFAWPEFCKHLGLSADTQKPNAPEIKAQLIANTEQAKADGAFGVPTLVIHQHCFWGVDTIPWAIDYLNRPGMFDEPAYQHAGQIPSGL
ncbi:2-hydroxychromene-2-carboxylate isomerase [Polynucleobacter sp. AP-Nino-20-G2]|uniref:2-hydroxychromene-2-carboxylate isomerase n=1 Tax=Polynucleobacter sp. AP-Nino-20-G2 TaxID=2576917 RepID=UPI001BFD8F16|nr:DsbA family protein [Polynucleobacter sp. AP-Nino-20-G2]QWE15795.1 DsbA family protein [Polynucleobacter sp. AP-Nino-20-G2]